MNQWRDFERSQNAAIKSQLEKEIYECKCGCTWFEQVRVNQYVSSNPIVIGQEVPPLTMGDFTMLKCARCGTMREPRMSLNNPTRQEEKKYREAIDDITAPLPEAEDEVQDPE